MTTLAFNEELLLDEAGSLYVIDGKDALAQNLKSALLLQRGTWFLDVNAGVPYFILDFSKDTSAGQLSTLIQSTILSFKDEVKRVLNVQINIEKRTRKFSFSCDVETIYGTISLSM